MNQSSLKCRVLKCTESHQNHYCKFCQNTDSDHFSYFCTLKPNQNVSVTQKDLNCQVPNYLESHLYHIGRNCHNEDSSNFTKDCPISSNTFSVGLTALNSFFCRVQGCQICHKKHECKLCKAEDSDHLEYNCPSRFTKDNSSLRGRQDPLPNERNSDNGNRERQELGLVNKNLSHPKQHCRAPECDYDHERHDCNVCGDKDADHVGSKCPNFNKLNYRKQPANLKKELEFGSKNRAEDFSREKQPSKANEGIEDKADQNVLHFSNSNVIYNNKSRDQDHFMQSHKGYIDPLSKKKQGPEEVFLKADPSQRKHCRVPECDDDHERHFCKICRDEDSDHFRSKCPNFNRPKMKPDNQQKYPKLEIAKVYSEEEGKKDLSSVQKKRHPSEESEEKTEELSKKMGLYTEPPREGLLTQLKGLFVSQKAKLYLPHKNKLRWRKMVSVLQSIERMQFQSDRDFDYLVRDIYELGGEKQELRINQFSTLSELRKKFRGYFAYKPLFSFMASLALDLPRLFQEPYLHLLLKSKNESLELSKMQVACLLSHIFFGTIHNRLKGTTFHRVINMQFLLETPSNVNIEKIACILNYFRQVHSMTTEKNAAKSLLDKTVRFRRVHLNSTPDWTHLVNRLLEFEVVKGKAMHEQTGAIEVDFANKMIGGGTLTTGSVQEEIRFMMSPECIISMLIFEEMEDNEVALIEGTNKINNYRGYKQSFEFQGDYNGEGYLESDLIVAMDAISYQHRDFLGQYLEENLIRELNKALTGFVSDEKRKKVATGKWGCGVFNGDPELKFMIQWMAASVSGKKMMFFPFGGKEMGLKRLEVMVGRVTVGEVFKEILAFNPREERTLFEFLLTILSSGFRK